MIFEDRTFENSKKDCTDEIEKIEEASNNHIFGNDHEILRSGFPDKWDYLSKKLAYPHKNFTTLDDYQRPDEIFKKEDFFSKLDIDYPTAEEKERT